MQLSRRLAITTLPLLLLAAACGSDSEGTSSEPSDGGTTTEAESLTLYTGRDEELVGPLVEQFTEETGIEVEVRYGNSAEMGAQLLEEGDSTPADVFYSQEVGAVGVLEQADLLADLPQETIDLVDAKYAPREGTKWVGVTGRSRVIAYNPDLVDVVPEGVEDLVDEQYAGQIAIAPSNASFQSFVTAFRVSQGDDAAREWLEGIIANDPEIYESNDDILQAVNNGDIGIGLINHYYWARSIPELGDELVAELVFPKGEDPGGLVNATAVAITNGGADNPASQELVDYLLSEAGQTYFVTETYEYPLVEGIAMPEGVPALDELEGPDIDLTDLESLEETQALLTELGLLS
jgi:iron(III) transport system substrate-binding protein